MALAETLQDNFDGGFNLTVWSKSDNSADATKVTTSNGRIRVDHTATSQYNAYSTAVPYNLTGSYFYTQIYDFGDQTITSHEVILSLYKDGTNAIWITASSGLLSAFKQVSGVQNQVGASINLDKSLHQWFRIRESGGTIFFDTSGNAVTWTNRWSLANPFAITAMYAQIQSGCWQNESNASYGIFDNFNISYRNIGTLPTTFQAGGMSAGVASN